MKSPTLKNLPLRVTLVLALVLLAAAGLIASGVAVTSSLENALVDRVDKSLIDASRVWAQPAPGTPTDTFSSASCWTHFSQALHAF